MTVTLLLRCSRRVNAFAALASTRSASRRRVFDPITSHGQVIHPITPARCRTVRLGTTSIGARTQYSTAATGAFEDEQGGSSRAKSNRFEVTSTYEPTGDQPQAIQQLLQQLQDGDKYSTLRGITGTGKTFVMSHVIAKWGRPTLVLCHNKTLAAQLARELRGLLSNNAVELFISYYNHYIPESFVETTGTYIAKKTSVNDNIDALRHRATRALLQRNDVVVVASVSCIYGLGLPQEYLDTSTNLNVGDEIELGEMVKKLKSMLYTKPEEDRDEMLRGNYQLSLSGANTSIVSLWPPHEKSPIRVEIENKDGISRIKSIISTNELGGIKHLDSAFVFPAKHHVVSDEKLGMACSRIEEELRDRVKELNADGRETEANRLQQRVLNDLMILRETGFCSGVENYSRHLAGRNAGEAPSTLMDYMNISGDGEWLLMVDESHVTLPQLKAMYRGDRSRKLKLVKHGYRLPSALDNRPLRNEEFWAQISRAVLISATPSKQELELSTRVPVEMMVRPTFVPDPEIEVRPPEGQLHDLLTEVKERSKQGERTLALALTKNDAEDLSSYLIEHDVKATFIHCSLTTEERANALKALQSGEVDCLVGVNLLREGLDLPQVSRVCILNADSEGFLRSETALLQTVGRAARNVNGKAIFYAKKVTKSMRRCIDATNRRRQNQLRYNQVAGVKPVSAKGSSMMSLFDLMKDEIEEEPSLEIVQPPSRNLPSTPTSNVSDLLFVSVPTDGGAAEVVTEHIPSKPGVYFWKDRDGNTLYIGKATKLRSRVKSYLAASAKHSPRIETMLSKAVSVDFVITPSERDALLLENNLIKHHQPPYNVLLKDDESYPYICATIGDRFPRVYAVPRKQVGITSSKYRFFGPYPHYSEINDVLDFVEEKYDLRAKSFAARHGEGITRQEYNDLFNEALEDVFQSASKSSLSFRKEYEEGSLLFESKYNVCRDVVAVGQEGADTVVVVVQLRDGIVAGRFAYSCTLPAEFRSESDLAHAIEMVLKRQHYPSGGDSSQGSFSFFPDELLLQFSPQDSRELRHSISNQRAISDPKSKAKTKVRTVASRGVRRETDERAMSFAVENAAQMARDRDNESTRGAAPTSVDGTASTELAEMLSMDKMPSRIECYDISHTQGDVAVGSRVVFIDGKPARHLYRKFNIRTVEGINDYASIAEVLERRFNHVWINGKGGLVGEDNPWSMPDLVLIDGGKGQLNAAVKGMSKARVYAAQSNRKKEEESRQAEVNVCALAKDKEELFVLGREEPVNEANDSAALLLLRALRDESHRFALKSHRSRRSAKLRP